MLSRNLCCRGKAVSITQSECLSLALVIQYSKLTRLSHVACLVLPQFPTLSNKERNFREKVIE